jgi:hypothetical protein
MSWYLPSNFWVSGSHNYLGVGILWIECLFLDLEANGTEVVMVPLMEKGKMEKMMMVMNESRRRLGSFQICALCTCCGGAKGLCLPSPCCYAINCNIPRRPFGFCCFTPKTCYCFGCHLWLKRQNKIKLQGWQATRTNFDWYPLQDIQGQSQEQKKINK